jgi:hypothetical protein
MCIKKEPQACRRLGNPGRGAHGAKIIDIPIPGLGQSGDVSKMVSAMRAAHIIELVVLFALFFALPLLIVLITSELM